MNYLAHLLLSGPEPGIKVGNFIGDHVKGRRYLRYSPMVQKGIILHRRIDDFTDKHPALKNSSIIFKEKYNRYAGVVMDIISDHFLAANWDVYSSQSLQHFVSDAHYILIRNYFNLPPLVKQFLPFLIKSRRMESYKDIGGAEKTLRIMASHSSLPEHSKWASQQLVANYEELKSDFFLFFDDTQKMANEFLVNHQHNDLPLAI